MNYRADALSGGSASLEAGMRNAAITVMAATFALLGADMASAEETPSARLVLELNALQPSDKGCRLTFVVSNKLGQHLTKAAFEIALFSDTGVVERLSILDFGDLPADKTKVTRFDLAGTDCAKVGRVLVNSATECVGEGVDPRLCMRALKPQSKSSVEFGV